MAIGDWVQIGGRVWNVRVTHITQEFNILDTDSAGRTLDEGAPMTLDALGVFYSHKVTFERDKSTLGEYDLLFMYLSTPRNEGIPVKIVHNQTTIEYDAYVRKGSRELDRIDDRKKDVYWAEMTYNFVPVRAQRVIGNG